MGTLQGYKTLVGAILLGVSTTVKGLEQAEVLPAGTDGAINSIVMGIGSFLTIFGIGDKLERKLGG